MAATSTTPKASRATDEGRILREILKLEEDLRSPQPRLQQLRLPNLLNIPDSVYDEMVENAQEVSHFHNRVRSRRLKRHKTREQTLEELAREKKKFLQKRPKYLEKNPWIYTGCYVMSRRIAAFFKYFTRLNMLVNFIQIAPQAWALFFWYHFLFLHVALAFAITSLEYVTVWRVENLAGEGSRELLGLSKQFEFVFCAGFFLAFVIGWTGARYRSKSLSVVYMLLLVLCTIFYLISANMENSEKNTEVLEKLLAERVKSFQEDPSKVPYLEQLQVQFACCGGKGPMDYLRDDPVYNSGKIAKLPKSCCLRVTSTISQRQRVRCRVQKNFEWPLELNWRGCGKALAEYLYPTLALKFPLSLAFTYMCMMSLFACITFINLYRRLKDKNVAPTTKVTLGEKLLTALDTHRVSVLRDCSDASADALRKRLARCETIPQIIFTIVQMINEVDHFLHIDPEFLAHQILRVKGKKRRGTMAEDLMAPGVNLNDTTTDSSGVGAGAKRMQYGGGLDENGNEDESYSRTRARRRLRPESDSRRMERLLAEVIRQSQNSVRSMKHQMKLIQPIASSHKPEEKELLPIAAKLLKTVTEIRGDEPK